MKSSLRKPSNSKAIQKVISLRSGVKLSLMKKLSLYIFLGLLWCNVGFAELIELNKCFKGKDSEVHETKIFNLAHRYDEHIWSINASTGIITQIEIFNDTFIIIKNDETKEWGTTLEKEKFSEFQIVNYTSNIIIGRTYYEDDSRARLFFKNPNDIVTKWEVRINLKDKSVQQIFNPTGSKYRSYNKIKKYWEEELRPGVDYSYKEFIEGLKPHTFDYYCEKSTSDSDKTGTSSGTAFFINNKGNLITNNHVVEGCELSKINYFNKEYDTNLISTDKTLDLALLEVDLKPKSFISFSKDEPKKRDLIIIAGYPLGEYLSDDLKINEGKISSLKGFDNNSNEITVDLAINPGNSGGPIVDENGQLVAVAVAGMSKEVTEGISFGIKSSAVTNFLKSNKISPDIKLTSFSMNKDKVNQLLEESTVYIFCE